MQFENSALRNAWYNGFSYAAACLGVLGVFSVLAFHFPEYLTTPQLRDIYSENQVRLLLAMGMGVALVCGAVGLVFSTRRRFALFGTALILLAWLAGGPNVPLDGPVRSARFYLSVDWMVLDLVLIATLFISLEWVSRRREQRVFRRDWRLDLTHYVVNHLFNGAMIFVVYMPSQALAVWLGRPEISPLAAWPLLLQVLAIVAVTDFAQYWVHRATHQVPLLWRFHKVHHSAEVMDWLAGSRLHFIDILLTRSLVLIPMVLLGFSQEAINFYLPLLALQSVFNHANVSYPLGALRKWVVTPQFHHWHHTRDPALVDKNFSVSLPVYDMLFGTYYCPRDEWPDDYGLAQPEFDDTYYAHVVWPFTARRPDSN
ncbi:MAG: sterol desaturase family protein [Halioglobus sp.]|nr:sterol desaturase family protein [Halioglobus sp.]